MRRRAAMALAFCGLCSPAMATSWISCADAEGAASFDFLVGALDVISVVGLTVSVGETVWASDAAYGPGDPVAVGQAFETAEVILIDAMDDNLMAVVAELRLFKAREGLDQVTAGTLRVPGHGAWAVNCIGP